MRRLWSGNTALRAGSEGCRRMRGCVDQVRWRAHHQHAHTERCSGAVVCVGSKSQMSEVTRLLPVRAKDSYSPNRGKLIAIKAASKIMLGCGITCPHTSSPLERKARGGCRVAHSLHGVCKGHDSETSAGIPWLQKRPACPGRKRKFVGHWLGRHRQAWATGIFHAQPLRSRQSLLGFPPPISAGSSNVR